MNPYFFSIFISSLNFTSIQSYFLITIKITIRVIIKYNIRIIIEIFIIENYNCQNCCYLNHYKNHLYKTIIMDITIENIITIFIDTLKILLR